MAASPDREPEQRRFVRIPVDSVQYCVDRLEVKTSEEVPSGLVEDVSFRIRQIIDTAGQFMHHSKRRRLTVDDVDKAMKFSGLEAMYGHHRPASEQDEEDILLDQIALAPASQTGVHPLPNNMPTVSTSWLVVEGVELSDKEALRGTIDLGSAITESQLAYLSAILEAATGEDDDHRRIVLVSIQNNLSVASVLPALIQYLQQTLQCWEQFCPVQLDRLLMLFLAVFRNYGLFLDPYCSAIFPSLKELLLSSSYLLSAQPQGVGSSMDHWHVRELTAVSMAQLLARCSSMLTVYVQDLASDFQGHLSSPCSLSLPVLYGAVLTLVHLGPASLVDVFLPHMQLLVRHLAVLSESATTNVKYAISKVMESIFLAAELLLTSHVTLNLPPLKSLSAEHSTNNDGSEAMEQRHVSGNDLTEGQTRLASSSSATATGLFGGSSLTLTSSSVLETDLQDRFVGGQPSHSNTIPSLYCFFAEVFGERLCVRLSAHHQYKDLSHHTRITVEEQKNQLLETLPEPDSLVVTGAMDRFLEREGFKAITVHLPRKSPPPPSASHSRGCYGSREPWTFSLPQTVLPVTENPLEKEGQVGGVKGNLQHVVKGPLLRRRERSRRLPPVDVGGTWL